MLRPWTGLRSGRMANGEGLCETAGGRCKRRPSYLRASGGAQVNANERAATAAYPASRRNAWRVLAALLFVYILNFADRVLLGVMAVPIKADLGLSDTQLGLLGGTAFALFYSTLGVPIGWLADRKSRSWIITLALVIWSGCTALCGMASSFITLFLARVGVGVGEAGGIAPSYSLISDYFPPHQRARALGIYSFGIPIGSAVGRRSAA